MRLGDEGRLSRHGMKIFLRPAPHRSASRRNATQRNVSFGGFRDRHELTSQRDAPQRSAPHRNAPPRNVTPQRNGPRQMSTNQTDTNTEIETFKMRDVTVTAHGITPYSPSPYTRDKEKGESWDDYEAATWRYKCHRENGEVYIPGSAFKLSIDEAAKNLNEKIAGKGNQTWTGVLKMGVAPLTNMPLGIKVEDLKVEKVFCHASGTRGVGPRVMRWFPIMHSWGGTMTFRIFNDSLTEAKFEEFFHKAGLLAGVGRGRPSTGCPVGNGRFRPTRFVWSDVT